METSPSGRRPYVTTNKTSKVMKSDTCTSLEKLKSKWANAPIGIGVRFKALCQKKHQSLKQFFTLSPERQKMGLKSSISLMPHAPKAASHSNPQAFDSDSFFKLTKDVGLMAKTNAVAFLKDNWAVMKSIHEIQQAWHERWLLNEGNLSAEEQSTLQEDLLGSMKACATAQKNRTLSDVADGAKSALKDNVQHNLIWRLGWSSLMLSSQGLQWLGKLMKLLGLVRVPFAYTCGDALQGFAELLRGGLYLRSHTMVIFGLTRASKNADAVEGLLDAMPMQGVRARHTAIPLPDLEKRAILKAIHAQKNSLMRALALVNKGLDFGAAAVNAVVIGLAVLTATGVLVGTALAMASPIAWTVGGIALGFALGYLGYYITKYAQNYHRLNQWEGCLQEATQSTEALQADPSSRSKLYQKLYQEGQEKLQPSDPSAINAYIQKRALSKVMRYDSSFLLEILYQKLVLDKDDDLIRLLSEETQILSKDLIQMMKVQKQKFPHKSKAFKPYFIRELAYALAIS
jgi:hypothetical protein